MRTDPTTAIVVYHGVLVDETEILRFVLSRLPGFHTVTVGLSRGQVTGPGGVETAEVALEEAGEPEIIAVPGGIGSHSYTEIASWLRTVAPTWLVTSSTGSTLLAAAGLLRDATAATHWLAGPLLERHGAHPSREQVVVDGHIVTCSGSSSAFRAALVIAEAYGGAELVARIRADAAAAGRSGTPARRWPFWQWLRDTVRWTKTGPTSADQEKDVLHLGLVTPPRRFCCGIPAVRPHSGRTRSTHLPPTSVPRRPGLRIGTGTMEH
jgi:putative intracellular protease/amidase